VCGTSWRVWYGYDVRIVTTSGDWPPPIPAPASIPAGLACIDDDEDPLLARLADSGGTVVAEEPAEPDLAWLARHSWEWDPVRLDELISAGALLFRGSLVR
jgi:hypothetical protein